MSEAAPFANLIQDAIHAALNPEKIGILAEKHVERLVEEAVQESFHSWTGTGKAITELVKASLQVKDLDLPSYGHVVSEIVRRAVEGRVAEVVSAKLAKDLDDLLNLAPKRIKLSELVAELLGPESEEQSHSVSCDVDWSNDKWARIKLTAKNVSGYHDVDVELHVMLPKKRAEYSNLRVVGDPPAENPAGPISFGHVSGVDLKRDHAFGYGTTRRIFALGRLFEFEQRILALYACETVIEIDEDDVVTDRGEY